MMITNEWEHISKINEAIGHYVILLYPDSTEAEALVYPDALGNVHYTTGGNVQHIHPPVFWRFK